MERPSNRPPGGTWAVRSGPLRRELERDIPREVLEGLHRLSPIRHFAAAGLLTVITASLALGLLLPIPLWAWVPLSLLLGLCSFDYTVLLHDALHRLVFPGRREGATRLLSFLYALPSGISPSQFARWHLDHHAGLGSAEEDPKRARLSPRRNERWLKVLYFTPALFWIYFRAAAKETATYGPALRRRILAERTLALAFHSAAAAALLGFAGLAGLMKVYLVPVFFGFPLAFGLNRLGQHYDIDPADPARWGTRMRRSRLWDLLFLGSSYHLEHHYFPGVPFYRLEALNRALSPFFESRGIPERSYGWLLWKYLAENRAPHTPWT